MDSGWTLDEIKYGMYIEHVHVVECTFLNCFQLYNMEYARNHWGQIKGEETFHNEWEKATPDIIFKIANEIIFNDQKPNAFAIHCF